MTRIQAHPVTTPPATHEVVRAQLAGLLAGSAAGAAIALIVSLGSEPGWHMSTVLVALLGFGTGGFLGVIAGLFAA